MSTNYYVRPPQCGQPCQHCGQAQEIHLGLSSGGWRFLHRAYPSARPWDGIDWAVTDRASWLKLLDLGPIYDEYGDQHGRDALLALIDGCQDKRSHVPSRGLDDLGEAATYPDKRFLADGYDFSSAEFS